MSKIKGAVTPRKINDLASELRQGSAESVSVEAGTDGLAAGTLQDALQALASRIQALEDAAA